MNHLYLLLIMLAVHETAAQKWVDTSYQIHTSFDITYGTDTAFAGREDTLRLDISYPLNDTVPECGRPLMAIIHGGAWLGGDKNEGYVKRWREDFAKRGYVTASINYRLGMFHTNQYINCNVPDWNCYNMTDTSEWYRANFRAIQDVNGALRYLVNQAAEYQIDPDNVFVVGESAGGFIAMGVGFIDDPSEVLSGLTEEFTEAPAPNQLYENNCIQAYGLANNIEEMDLSRPGLGDYQGSLNTSMEEDYQIKAVGSFYGGAFNNIFESHGTQAPALYLYHQPCDLIVPYLQNKLLAGLNSCFTGFPTFCQNIINRPIVFGSLGIKQLIDEMAQNNIPACDYFFDNTTSNADCLQQAIDPNAVCHAIDNYWLRSTNMATYFAGFIDSCQVINQDTDLSGRKLAIDALYPNPANNKLYLKLSHHTGPIQIQCFTVLGNNVDISYQINQSEIAIDVSTFSSGWYYLEVVSEKNQRLVCTFIKS
jgi:hypothetical protein